MTPAAPSPSAQRHRSLLFGLGDSYYRIELLRLKEVVPWVALDPAEERGLLGWLTLRGERIPVVDLTQLVLGTPTEPRLGSRILILDCPSRGRQRTVGALAGQVFAMAQEENSAYAERFDPCDVLSSVLAALP
jgi:chemotaxis-related protein WspB